MSLKDQEDSLVQITPHAEISLLAFKCLFLFLLKLLNQVKEPHKYVQSFHLENETVGHATSFDS